MHNEQVFTHKWVVKTMLDRVGYNKFDSIYEKHIIDNSCGDGAFLSEIVDRYIWSCKYNNIEETKIISDLETYIHGIEIDTELCTTTKENLNNIACKYNIHDIQWDIVHSDAVDCLDSYKGKMDYVVGNPPYCKVHDLTKEKREKYKSLCHNASGTFDSYIMFFWIGLDMLKADGRLIYITPSSWTNSLYAKPLRQYFIDNNSIVSIIDFKNTIIFENATTFTMVTEIKNSNKDEKISVSECSMGNIMEISNLKLSDYLYNGKFYFKSEQELEVIKEIDSDDNLNGMFDVKNGFATLNDKLFIREIKDSIDVLTDGNTILCTKASTNSLKAIIYPYDKNGKPLKFEQLGEKTKKELLKRAEELDVDTSNPNWYLYGRSQAINDVWKDKYIINNLIKDKSDVKLKFCHRGNGVYSGVYILSKDEFKNEKTINFLFQTLNSYHFEKYVKSLGRYKNGGYMTFTTKELKKYLNYMWEKYNDYANSNGDYWLYLIYGFGVKREIRAYSSDWMEYRERPKWDD